MKRAPYGKHAKHTKTIHETYKAGFTATEIAKDLGIPYSFVYNALRGTGLIRAKGGITVTDGTKICSMCKKTLPVANFDIALRRTVNGYRPDCKVCRAVREKITRVRYNEMDPVSKRAVLDRNRESKLRNPESLLLKLAKVRARKKGLPFNITAEDIVIPEVCPVFGMPLLFNRDLMQQNSPTLDRLEPDKGYVKGNVAVISWKANRIKTNASLKELEQIVSYLKAQQCKHTTTSTETSTAALLKC